MKNLIIFFALLAVTSTSCQKEDLSTLVLSDQRTEISTIQSSSEELRINQFTGIVVSQDNYSVDSTVVFDFKRISSTATGIGPSYLYSNHHGIVPISGYGFPVFPLNSNVLDTNVVSIYDSISMPLYSGNYFIGGYKSSQEYLTDPDIAVISDYGVRIKVYVNGIIILNKHSNYIRQWFSIP